MATSPTVSVLNERNAIDDRSNNKLKNEMHHTFLLSDQYRLSSAL